MPSTDFWPTQGSLRWWLFCGPVLAGLVLHPAGAELAALQDPAHQSYYQVTFGGWVFASALVVLPLASFGVVALFPHVLRKKLYLAAFLITVSVDLALN